MSTPFASIGGLASGLDTGNIIQQLMQLERRPIRAIEQRQSQYRAQDQAWGQILTKLSNLRGASDKLTDGSFIRESVTASSSTDTVATVDATGAASPGTVTFDVQQLATRHQVAFGQTFTNPDDTVGPGTFTVTRGSENLEVALGEGASIADAANALNGVEGISAQLLRTGDGQYQLITTASDSGASASFELTADGLTGFDDPAQALRTGQDAVLNLGGTEPGTELLVSRSTNHVDDLLDGVSIRLRGTGQVTVDVEQDVDAAVEKVHGFITAANAVFDELAKQSRTSTEADQRGPLSSDSLVRNLAFELRSTISGIGGSGEYANLASLGIELTRDGKVEFDQSRLREALASDPDAVANLLGRTAEADDPRVRVTRSGRAEPGEYGLQVDTAATIASRVGASYTPPTGDPTTFTITVPGQDPVEVTLTTEDTTAAAAVAKINQALLEANIERVRASVGDGDELVLSADRAGSSRSFTVEGSDDLGLDGTFTGTDAGGTISFGGEAYGLDGSGQSLTVADGPGQGMVVRVPVEVTGDLGAINIADGLGGVMDRFLRRAEGSDGSIARARDSLESRIDAAKASIERFENRLEIRERGLRRQFAGLESAMARANQQAQWLSSQLGAMMG